MFTRQSLALLFLLILTVGTSALSFSQEVPSGDISDDANATKVCRSQGGRFPPYEIHGARPRRVKGAESLSLCRAYKWKTCCSNRQTDAALVWLRKLATSGEAGPECLALWEVVECAVCDPDVGTSEGPPVICPSLCDKLLAACRGAFFALDAMTQDLVPCGRRDLVCTAAAEWASSGAQFCQLAGYRVADDVTADVSNSCFDGTRIPPPGGREKNEAREKKRRVRGFWDAAKRGGELEGGLGFTVVLTSAVVALWLLRKYGRYLGVHKVLTILASRGTDSEQRTVQDMLQEARRRQQARYTQGVEGTPVTKKKL